MNASDVQSVLILVNDAAYGSDRSFNALRLASALAKRDDTTLRIFLMGDAVGCAIAGQHAPDGYYHLDRMLEVAAQKGAEIGCCGTCMDARGIRDDMIVGVARRASLDELAEWTIQVEKVISF
jgi:uncharacterized protein involved in oxidation of intracellular sulfur